MCRLEGRDIPSQRGQWLQGKTDGHVDGTKADKKQRKHGQKNRGHQAPDGEFTIRVPDSDKGAVSLDTLRRHNPIVIANAVHKVLGLAAVLGQMR